MPSRSPSQQVIACRSRAPSKHPAQPAQHAPGLAHRRPPAGRCRRRPPAAPRRHRSHRARMARSRCWQTAAAAAAGTGLHAAGTNRASFEWEGEYVGVCGRGTAGMDAHAFVAATDGACHASRKEGVQGGTHHRFCRLAAPPAPPHWTPPAPAAAAARRAAVRPQRSRLLLRCYVAAVHASCASGANCLLQRRRQAGSEGQPASQSVRAAIAYYLHK
jgi:hypothetical protein